MPLRGYRTILTPSPLDLHSWIPVVPLVSYVSECSTIRTAFALSRRDDNGAETSTRLAKKGKARVKAFSSATLTVFKTGSSTISNRRRPLYRLPFHHNLQDNCIVVANGKGTCRRRVQPRDTLQQNMATVDLMLLEDKGDFKFQTWEALKEERPGCLELHFCARHRRGDTNAL